MPSSKSRMRRRLQLGVYRKSVVTRWIGQWVVRIHVSGAFRGTLTDREKASEGAERSCRVRRKRRGQRKGKCRARGRHPREPLLPAPTAKPPKSRSIARALRTYEFWEGRARQFRELIGQANTRGFTCSSSDGVRDVRSQTYLSWRTRRAKLFSKIRSTTNKVFAETLLQTSFDEYLFWVLGYKFPSTVRGRETGLDDLFALVERIRPLATTLPLEPNQGVSHTFRFVCSFCPTAWSGANRIGRCPTCRRPAASDDTKKGRRRGRGRG